MRSLAGGNQAATLKNAVSPTISTLTLIREPNRAVTTA
jgi:hypothetical protein